ncbi:MAG: AAA family ATPase [Solirubrobacterales bacterium]
MGLFNRKNPEGRTAESEASREPKSTEAEAEVAIRAEELPDPEPAPTPEPAAAPRAEEPAPAADPYGDELRELESKAVADAEPAVEAVEVVEEPAEPAPAAAVTDSEPSTGKLDKEELRRAVKGTDAEPEDDGRVSADELIGPTLKRRHPFAPEPEEPAAEKTMKVFAFANQKGGVAKTTTTLNLAVALSESGHRVLCVDLDPQGNLTMSQGIDPDTVEKSLYHVLVERMPIKEIIQHREVDIAVASIDLAGAEIAMSTQIGRERSLQKALAQVADEYDYVCIDTPPSLGLLTINALTAADKVIVPVQCEYLSMRGLVQLQNTLEMIRENLNPDVQIEGILPTMLDTRTIHAKEAVEILEENFGELVFKSRIRKAIKFAEAPVKGSSVLKYDPQSNAAQCYRDLAEEVLEHGSKE